MSQSLRRELDTTSKGVNAVLAAAFADMREPKDIYDAARHPIKAGGKRIRPFLTLKSCEVVGGNREDAFPVAAAIELVHNFTIIHDDIMDADTKRRGAPTVHVIWGVPMAIIGGDMLFAKAYEVALGANTLSSKRLLKVVNTITDATINVCEGQALDMLFENRRDVTEDEYLEMVYKKTAALLEAAAEIGALAGGGTPAQVKKLGELGRCAGLAFQVVDDILGLTADEGALGKPVGSDIREGKSTILVIHALEHADLEQRKKILSVLGNRSADSSQMKEAIQTIQSLGSMEHAAGMAEEYIGEAKAQLSSFPSSPAKNTLIDLCDYIVARNY